MAKEVILLQESVWQSFCRDALTFATFAAMIGLGVYLDSSAMQWVGGVLFFIALMARVVNTGKRNTYTIEQAREKLDEIEEARQ